MSPARSISTLVVAGLGSGTGKTSLTVGLAAALRRRGLSVATFKVGPDYLDPTYHARASGRPCHNLDLWMMGPDACRREVLACAGSADIAIIEGAMGLFDGARPDSDEGSTAELARELEAPVVLCVDVSGMARTLAAIVRGVQAHDPGLHMAGVVANRCGSPGHRALLERALDGLSPPVRLLGGLPKQAAPGFTARHLGLQAARQDEPAPDVLQAWADAVEGGMDLGALVAQAGVLRGARPAASPSLPTPRCRIGVARDEAFHFYYPYNLRALREAGAELIEFSPLRDPELPEVDGIILGGGYPELYASALSDNRGLRRQLRDHAQAGGFLYAECGGLMYLTHAIVDQDGARHPMVGLIEGEAAMRDRLQALGFVELQTCMEGPLGPSGTRMRGHQFRYSELRDAPEPHRYAAVRRRDGHAFTCGYGSGQVWASYVHAHWAFSPQVPTHIVQACRGKPKGAWPHP